MILKARVTDSHTKVILIKKTVYEGLFEAVAAQHPVAHADYIAFPGYYNDLNFIEPSPW